MSCGTVLWRYRGRLELTTIVKATFALVPDAVMIRLNADPVHHDDIYFNDDPRSGMAAASDLAPYRMHADVLLVGGAFAPPDTGSTGARMVVTRGKVLLDKSVQTAGDPRAAPFGPIPQSWPIRRRLLGAADPRALAQPIAEFPTDFNWAYFQVAPPDQRTDYLRGGEWIDLHCLHPAHERLRSQVPEARAAAKVYGPGDDDKGRALLLHADTLHIDLARGCCSLVWRSCLPLAAGTDPSALCVLAGVETAGQPVTLPRSLPAGELPKPAHPDDKPHVALPRANDDLTATVPLAQPAQPASGHAPSIVLPARRARPRHGHSGTLVMDDQRPGSPPPAAPAPALPLASPPAAGVVMLQQTAIVADDAMFDLRAPFAIAAPGTTPATAGSDIPGAPWSPGTRVTPLPPPHAPDEPTAVLELPSHPHESTAAPEPLASSPAEPAPVPAPAPAPAPAPVPAPAPEPAPPPPPRASVPGLLYQRFASKKKGPPP